MFLDIFKNFFLNNSDFLKMRFSQYAILGQKVELKNQELKTIPETKFFISVFHPHGVHTVSKKKIKLSKYSFE